MPKILVRIADTQLRDDIAKALGESNKKNNVIVGDPVTSADNQKELATSLAESKAAAVILDYLTEDAASVKLLQAVTDSVRIPHFIFIMPEQVEISQVLMAVNEGASAVIEQPVKMSALVNYVERAISGPGRFRREFLQHGIKEEDVADFEKQIRVLRQQINAYQKIIPYLLETPLSSQNRRVLVVSDSAYQRDLLKKLLEDHLFSVITATNAEEGLNTALAEKPLIVVSDLEMEGQNGVEFCRNLKITHKLIPCHFIICTANSEKVDAVMAPGNGIDDCVLKPNNENGYRELISRVALGLMLEDGK